MSSIDVATARRAYKGTTEAEMLCNMAKAHGCRLIYKYANDFGDKRTHTDYKIIMMPGDWMEQAFLNAPNGHNIVLVYKDGSIVNERIVE